MEGSFLPLKEAASLAETDHFYLHKLIKAGKVQAKAEKRGKLQYWFVDITCPRFINSKKKN